MRNDLSYLHLLANNAVTGIASVASECPSISLGTGGAVLWKQACVQIELVSLAPGTKLPDSKHPALDEVLRFLGGDLSFSVMHGDGKDDEYNLNSDIETHRHKHIEIPKEASFRGTAGGRGAVYLSVSNFIHGPSRTAQSVFNEEGMNRWS